MGGEDWALAEYNPDGTLNAAFGQGGRVVTSFSPFASSVSGIAIQPDGKIVVSGTVALLTGFDFGLTRYNPDGSLDPSFGTDGQVMISIGSFALGAGVAIQPDGKIVETGLADGEVAVVRVNSDGSLDSSFGTGGEVLTTAENFSTVVDIQPDGKILVGGAGVNGEDFGLVRFNPDGSLDPSFGTGGAVDTPSTYGIAQMALQPDGKIVAVGTVASGAALDFQTVRYNPDGSLDQSFGSDGMVMTDLTPPGSKSAVPNSSFATGVVIQPGGKIVVGGMTYNRGPSRVFLVSRRLPSRWYGTTQPAIWIPDSAPTGSR
jgi:uncharacterized delta-60 repeat protein